MVKLWLDFETRSAADLRDVGLDNYAKDDTTEVLMLAYAFDNDEPQLWEPRNGPMPFAVHQALINENVMKCAWNYNFEKDVFEFRLGYSIPLDQWYDPSVLCAYMSLPIGLDRAANALHIDIEAKKIHLVGKGNPKDLFCKPSKTTKTQLKKNPELSPTYYKNWDSHPEMWEQFREYCLQDVRAERAVWDAAVNFNSPMTTGEMEAWLLDQRMNERGVWIDQAFVANAKALAEEEANDIVAQIKTITGVKNPNSGQQLLKWLNPRGYNSTSVDKENVDNALRGLLHGSKHLASEVMTVLELKQKLGGSAYKKLQSIEDRMGKDGRLRDQFVYHGAHTGRWSGRGVQLQNLFKPDKAAGKISKELVSAIRGNTFVKREDITTMKAIASVIRAAFAATPGKKLVVGDLAQIESRVLAALAGCQVMIDAYASGADLYKDFMAWMLQKSVTEIDSDERARGKVVILGCGFGMGVDKFVDYAATFGITMSESDAKEAVYGFRKKYKEIPQFWNDLDTAVKKAVKLNICLYVKGLIIDGRNPDMLRIKLPSGRYLHYLHPRVEIEERFGKMQEGINYTAYDAKGKQVKRLYGGLLCENVVQAVARDLLLNGMVQAEKIGFEIIMTIHDEIVGETNLDSGLGEKELLTAMKTQPDWAEGMGFVLEAEGYENAYYRK